jgi:hypothetical protein
MRMPGELVGRGAASVLRPGGQLGEDPQQRGLLVGELTLPRERHHDEGVRGQPGDVDARQEGGQLGTRRRHGQTVDRIGHHTHPSRPR